MNDSAPAVDVNIEWQPFDNSLASTYIGQIEEAITHILQSSPGGLSWEYMKTQHLKPGADFYRKYFSGILAKILSFSEEHPEMQVYVHEFESIQVEGNMFPLLGFKFQPTTYEPTSVVVVTAQLHGNEKFGTRVLHHLIGREGHRSDLAQILSSSDLTLELFLLPNPEGTIEGKRSASGDVDLLRNMWTNPSPGPVLPLLSWQSLTRYLPWYMGTECSAEMDALLAMLQDAVESYQRILMVDIHSWTPKPGIYWAAASSVDDKETFYLPLYRRIETVVQKMKLLFTQWFHTKDFTGYARKGDYTETLLGPAIQEEVFGKQLIQKLYFLTLESGGVGILPFFQRLFSKLAYMHHRGLHRKRVPKGKVLWKSTRRVLNSPLETRLNPTRKLRQQLLKEHVILVQEILKHFGKNENALPLE